MSDYLSCPNCGFETAETCNTIDYGKKMYAKALEDAAKILEEMRPHIERWSRATPEDQFRWDAFDDAASAVRELAK